MARSYLGWLALAMILGEHECAAPPQGDQEGLGGGQCQPPSGCIEAAHQGACGGQLAPHARDEPQLCFVC